MSIDHDGRVDVVDALRGFALFGVAISNVAVFAGSGALPGTKSSLLDNGVGLLFAFLVTGKFLALFALTFGLSFGLFLRRCDERDESGTVRFLRRLAGLMLIGAVHRVLSGADILMTYALLGVVLLVMRNASDNVLLVSALASLALPELWSAFAGWLEYRPPPPAVNRAERTRLAVEGPYLDLVGVRARMLTGWWTSFVSGSTSYLALFLVGLWTARNRLLEQPVEHRRALRVACWGGLALAVCGFLAQELLRPSPGDARNAWASAAFGMLWNATTFVQAIGYGAGLVLLWSHAGLRAGSCSDSCLPVMALTNYLAISVVVTIIVTSTGTYGQLGFASAAALGALLWAVELVVSAWWLRRFRIGPVEWLWRLMTYGQVQPMRPALATG